MCLAATIGCEIFVAHDPGVLLATEKVLCLGRHKVIAAQDDEVKSKLLDEA